ncbi:glycoprotein 3-alpha-L-fucosyltransferase A-like [Acyrthosiphon pisum]|uniref:Fucosyltransferase n=1 Tax=Acyrthosiphon pisum TaxID=7029 RepID=A0A8R1W8T7_ACYPI|nr:glycoprotein 3-alpha-L-fucosyltransferase A-like [Acyrthosiphon pisum]|eukprot:XP_003242420.1 PREDICTED: glycoprotein 3-alpha-L-fucosyltransferase A-like isoform X1 [Acyrthosiphon pisum]
MDRRIHHLLNDLLILMLFIIVIYSIFTAYCPVKNKLYSRKSYKYEKKIKTQTNNDEQIVETVSTILSKNSDRIIKRNKLENLPWYFKDGIQEPNKAEVNPTTGVRISRLWPEEKKGDDRVEEQLMFIPPNYQYENAPMKTILLYNGISNWMVDEGQSEFLSNDCPVNRCIISTKTKLIYSMDAILFREEFYDPLSETGFKKNSKQIWILFFLQSAYYSGFDVGNDMINWTATYRHDSDIVIPYGRWAYFDPSVTRVEQLNINYSLNKTKQVAMIITNCDTDNQRLLYAKELGKYISVDVYGQCKGYKMNKFDNFLQILDQDYKFYLAFESSNCIDYVTEKFFIDGLQYNVLPVVMGGRREDYERMAPRRSYLHVDDFDSPKRLAEYLRQLDADDDLYNEYFRWKGTGEFIDTKFFCRLCALLHDEDAPAKHYRDLERWWRPPDVCDHSTKWLKPPPVE